MAQTYRALSAMLSYRQQPTAALMPAALEALQREKVADSPAWCAADRSGVRMSRPDLYEAQARYVDLFDRTRSLSLQLYEHVHGESRDRGQAMVELLRLYSSRGLELTAKELPDHLPVFGVWSLLSTDQAAALPVKQHTFLEALRERLKKRQSPYARVFDVSVALVETERNAEALKALLQEPDDDPDDLEALDKASAEGQETFGPDKVGCPKATAMLSRMEETGQ